MSRDYLSRTRREGRRRSDGGATRIRSTRRASEERKRLTAIGPRCDRSPVTRHGTTSLPLKFTRQFTHLHIYLSKVQPKVCPCGGLALYRRCKHMYLTLRNSIDTKARPHIELLSSGSSSSGSIYIKAILARSISSGSKWSGSIVVK